MPADIPADPQANPDSATARIDHEVNRLADLADVAVPFVPVAAGQATGAIGPDSATFGRALIDLVSGYADKLAGHADADPASKEQAQAIKVQLTHRAVNS